MRRDRFATAILVIGLALGVATSTFVFGFFANSFYAFNKSLPPHPELVVGYLMADAGAANSWYPLAQRDARAWVDRLLREGLPSGAVYEVFAAEERIGVVTAIDALIPGVLGFKAAQGSLIARRDYETGAPVCMLGHRAANRLNLGDNAIGKALPLWGKPFKVVGVLAAGGDFWCEDRIVIPFASLPKTIEGQTLTAYVFTRAQNALQVKAAMRQWQEFAAGIMDRYPGRQPKAVTVNRMWTLELNVILIPFLIGSLLLFIACLNLANMTVARLLRRRIEIGIRKAAGATSGMLRRQFLTEGVMIGFLSGIPGFFIYLLILFVFRLFARNFIGAQKPDSVILLYSVSTAVFAGGLTAWLASLNVARLDPISALADSDCATAGGDYKRRLKALRRHRTQTAVLIRK